MIINGYRKPRPFIPRVSKHQIERKRKYSIQRRVFLKQNPKCEVCVEAKSKDVHHRKGRGPYLLDESTWSAVCRACHDRIHSNPQWAFEQGWLESRLQKQPHH